MWEQAIDQYENLSIGNTIALGVALGLTGEEIHNKLPAIIAKKMQTNSKSRENGWIGQCTEQGSGFIL